MTESLMSQFTEEPALGSNRVVVNEPASAKTLRDEFAGLAMAAIISGSMSNGATFDVSDNDHVIVSQLAYAQADAMLRERLK